MTGAQDVATEEKRAPMSSGAGKASGADDSDPCEWNVVGGGAAK